MKAYFRRPKKTAVQLTSLLDLLFVMIFVSLLQKSLPIKAKEEKKAPPVAAKAKSKPIVKPAPKKPAPQKVILDVSAKFNFYAIPENPSLPEGIYSMRGSFNTKTREIRLGGVNWDKRPTNYDMVPLKGFIDETNKVFRGRIEFQGCEIFTLQKITTKTTTPISGVWQGTYRCSQGATGLKLTIN